MKTLEVAPGVSVLDPAAFEGREIELLRILLSPLSTAEDDGTGKAAGLPEDVALVVARYADAAASALAAGAAPGPSAKRLSLGPWTLDAAVQGRPVPRFVKVSEDSPELERQGDLDNTTVLATSAKSAIFWRPEDGYVAFTETNQFEALDGNFAEEMRDEYHRRVDALAKVKTPEPLRPGGSLDAHVNIAVTAISRIHTLLAIPPAFLAEPLPKAFQGLFSASRGDDVVAFCASGCALGEEDATKPVLRDRFRKDGLVVLWDLLTIVEKMSDDAFRDRAAPVRTSLEALLDKRWIDAQGPTAKGRWRRPD